MPDATVPRGDLAPTCAIVIPVFNKAELTRQCLEAIRKNTCFPDYEVIVVDNNSTDETAELLAGLEPPFRSIRNAENLGFARACNAGARTASSEYVLFLNNDTIPQPGWLVPMVGVLREQPDVGIVGSKLLYPCQDLIQHAGLGFIDSSPYHIWRLFPPDFPEANIEKEIEAVTGACMLVRRRLFDELGGFDEGYLNGFEDVDFCLRARELGRKIVYCPRSVLYHLESMTEGRMSHNKQNGMLYLKRWADKAITTHPIMKHCLARIGMPLLKTNFTGDRFVMFYERAFLKCDKIPPCVHTYRSWFSYALARAYYSLRYIRYRGTIKRTIREAAIAPTCEKMIRQCAGAIKGRAGMVDVDQGPSRQLG